MLCKRALFGRPCAACLLALMAAWYVVLFSDELLNFHRGGVWRAYFVPSPDTWDAIHRHGQQNSGGVWKYDQQRLTRSDVFRYLARKKYTSLLDVSCNVGFILSSLMKMHPAAKHYGTDISVTMVETAQENCPMCAGFAQFDLGRLSEEVSSPQELLHEAWGDSRKAAPKTFDVILVSDVLYYISWGGIPPVLFTCECCCGIFRRLALPSQRRFMENLASLANDEVLFSSHQGNLAVTEMMKALGAQLEGALFRLPGTAGKKRHGSVQWRGS